RTEIPNQRTAARERDVLSHALLEFRFDPLEQIEHHLHDLRHNRFTCTPYLRGDVEVGWHAVDGRSHDDRLRRLADETVLLLPLADHKDSELFIRIARLNQIEQLRVDRITGHRQRALIVFSWITPLHHNEVGGARADVDDH